MKKPPFLLLLLLSTASFSQIRKIGYHLSASDKGNSHFLYYGQAYKYVEIGAKAGFGVSGQYAFSTFQDTNVFIPTGSNTRSFENSALKLEVPVRAGIPKWPHLIAQLGYEHIYALDGAISEKKETGFPKFNDFYFYPGVGYELILMKRASVFLNLLSRYILTDRDKLRYFDIEADGINGRTYKVEQIDPTLGSRVFWQAGVNYIF